MLELPEVPSIAEDDFTVGRAIVHTLRLGNFDGLVVVLCHTSGDADRKRAQFTRRPALTDK